MAVIAHPLRPRLQSGWRSQHPLALGGVRTLVVLVVLAMVMALTTLAQTGHVATKGYKLVQINDSLTELQREADLLRMRIAQAQSLTRVEERAREGLGMRPMTPEQIRYITIEVPALPAEAAR